MELERDLEKDFVKIFEDFHQVKCTIKHYPDRIIFLSGAMCVFLELKVPGKKQTKTQEKIANKLKRQGFRVYLITNKNQMIILKKELQPFNRKINET